MTKFDLMPRSLATIRRQRQERGSVLIITSAMILVLLGILALSIDMGYVLTGRTQLQNAVDAAARAAASGLHAAIEPVGYSQQDNQIIKPLAIKYASLNSVRRYPSVKTQDLNTYPEGLKEDPNNSIKLNDGDIDIKHELIRRASPSSIASIRIRISRPRRVMPRRPCSQATTRNASRAGSRPSSRASSVWRPSAWAPLRLARSFLWKAARVNQRRLATVDAA